MNIFNIAIIFENTIRPDTTGNYFKNALENLGYSFDHYNSNLYLSDSIPDKYKLYLCIDDGFDKNKPIRKYEGISAFYAIDTHLTFKTKAEKAKHYDFVFCAQKDGAEKMRRKGINAFWVPLGFDHVIHKHVDIEKTLDLAFIGNINIMKERQRLISNYKNKYKIFIGKASFTEISRIYSQSKIVLNWPIKNDINMRFFEALGSGSFLLNKIVKNGEDELARNGTHYVTFSNWWDLDKKIAFYLKNDKEREEIAKKGHELAISNFTYDKRAKQILEILNINS